MSQFGMQMPGGRMRRGPSLDVYAAMLTIAFFTLVAAVVVVWVNASKLSPSGQPWDVQESGNVELTSD